MIKKFPLSSLLSGLVLVTLVLVAVLLLRRGVIASQPTEDMVMIPAGEFQMGLTYDQMTQIHAIEEIIDLPYGQPELPHAYPPLRVWLDEYQIDKYEVSNGDYQACVNEGDCQPRPAGEVCNVAETACEPDESGELVCSSDVSCTYTRNATIDDDPYFFDPAYADYPMVNVTWNEAQTYCEWRGGRLPTEAEWEKAARGTDDRLYPWGNEWDASRVSSLYAEKNNPRIPATLVELIPANNQSPYGVFNMVGGVLEWTHDLYHTYSPYHDDPRAYRFASSQDSGPIYIVRGGIVTAPTLATVTNRSDAGAYRYPDIGFRCVIADEPQPLGEISELLPWYPLPDPQPVELNSSDILYIPSGEFLYGALTAERWLKNEPILAYVSAFYIDRYEVTQSAYGDFLLQVGANYRACYYQNCYYDYSWDELISQLVGDAAPASPTWYGAVAYCNWKGGRLPTEIEWEKANPETRVDFSNRSSYDVEEWTADLFQLSFPNLTSIPYEITMQPYQYYVTIRYRYQDDVLAGMSNRDRGTALTSAVFRCVYP